MGVRFDMNSGSRFGVDVPGSTWTSFSEAIRAHGVTLPWTEVAAENVAKAAEEFRAVSSLLPEGPEWAEGADRHMAVRVALLAEEAHKAGKGLVWS